MRCSPPGWKVGKRGALRVCFVFFEQFKKVLLTIVYHKSEKDDLSQAEKARIKAVINRIEGEFDKRTSKQQQDR